MMTLRCLRTSAQDRTSLMLTQIASKELDTSQAHTTSPFVRMPDLLSMPDASAPLHCQPLIRTKLDEWEKEDIITPVEEPTDWVSSLAYSMKPNGKLRLCLNPKDLNLAIKRDHYKTPTVEEITHKLARSTRFTKLDGTSSYLCIVLDYESSLLTTFNTPWG